MQLSSYLFFDGNCEAACKFYEKCFGAKIVMMMTYDQAPDPKVACEVPPESVKKIMHARLTVGDVVLMASDAPPGRFQKPQGFAAYLGFDTPAEADRVFQALAENGTVTMPIDKTFWAARFGMLVDQFGTPWMVSCERPA